MHEGDEEEKENLKIREVLEKKFKKRGEKLISFSSLNLSHDVANEKGEGVIYMLYNILDSTSNRKNYKLHETVYASLSTGTRIGVSVLGQLRYPKVNSAKPER